MLWLLLYVSGAAFTGGWLYREPTRHSDSREHVAVCALGAGAWFLWIPMLVIGNLVDRLRARK